MRKFKISISLFILILTTISCSKRPMAKQSFAFKLSAYSSGIEMTGGSYVNAISSDSNKIVKLDAENSAEFPQGFWEFQTVRFQGPLPFGGKRFCGLIQNINLTAINQNVTININENNCLSEPFLSLITKISNDFDPTPIKISSITPNTGDIDGGTTVTILGSGFNSGATASLGGASCSSLTVTSSTLMTCITSPHPIGPVIALVTNTDTKSGHLPMGFNYKDLVGPDVSAMSFNDGNSEWATINSPMITWNPAIDLSSGVKTYEIAIGTTSGSTDVQDWIDVGNVLNYKVVGLSLMRGQKYYASIRAIDNNLNVSAEVIGDGWSVTNEMWVTDGDVYASVISGTTMYLGGTFTQLSEWTGSGVPISLTSGLQSWPNPLSRARVSGYIETVISDGNGGYFIGGGFSDVNGVVRNNLAHILADGSVSSWNPNVNSNVKTMAINGGTLYVGGGFYMVNGNIPRKSLAAFNLVNGALTNWNPNVEGSVLTIAINGNTLYAGGYLSTVNSPPVTRNHIAAIDLTTAVVTNWNPDIAGTLVNSLSIYNNTIYVGGYFNQVGSDTRNNLAAIDLTSGSVTAWDPNANQGINALTISGTTLFVGGTFTNIGATTRNKLASFELSTGSINSFNPSISGDVYTLQCDSGNIYMGGSFQSINSTPRKRLAAINISTETLINWDPNMNGIVNTISINSGILFAGGKFSSVNASTTRNNLAAIDISTGALKPWNPNANSSVYSLAIYGSDLYAGGSFTSVSGNTKSRLAAIDLSTGAPSPFTPTINSTVRALAIKGNILYTGGEFNSIGGQTRNKLAAFDLSTSALESWNPDVSGGTTVSTINLTSDTLYAGGDFTQSGGLSRANLSAINLSDGTTTSWNPVVNNKILTSSINGNNLYIGGYFTSAGGIARNRLAAIDLTSATATNWNPNMDGNVFNLIISGNTLYASGGFWTVSKNAAKRAHIAAINLNTGDATNWNPNNVINTPYSLTFSESTIFAGGIPYEINSGSWLPGF